MSNKSLLILILAFLSATPLLAGDSLAHRVPGAILVQLRSEHNRIKALTAAKNYRAVEEVKEDARKIIAAIKIDFIDHFDYCPVYYFMDTNYEQIKNKAFDGVLTNPDGSPAKNTNTIKNYRIVYFGYAAEQANSTDVLTDSARYLLNTGTPRGRGLVVMNEKFQQVQYLRTKPGAIAFTSKKNKIYYYSSKHFDMEYYAVAKQFNQLLSDGKGQSGTK